MLNGITARLCPDQSAKKKWMIGGGVGAGLLVIVIIVVVATTTGGDKSFDARDVLTTHPLIDGHNDFAYKLYKGLRNQLTDFQFNVSLVNDTRFNLEGDGRSQTDLRRLQDGLVGAQFWSAYAPCETNFKDGVARVFEQIDVINRLVAANHEHMQSVASVDGIRDAFKNRRIASLIGVEGGYAIDSRLGVLRQLYALGVRYMSLVHNCHLPWAETHAADGGAEADRTPAAKQGLTAWGEKVVREMNRLGMMVDLSHASVQTQKDAIAASSAPVIYSHSSAWSVQNHTRNVRDEVLALLKQKDGVVMINFGRNFVDPANATLARVIDHIEHIRRVMGTLDHIGLGADFDGTKDPMPTDLEDVSKYPALFTELIKRGWTMDELGQLAGENLLRVFGKVEQQRSELAHLAPIDDQIPDEDLKRFDEQVKGCRSDYVAKPPPTTGQVDA